MFSKNLGCHGPFGPPGYAYDLLPGIREVKSPHVYTGNLTFSLKQAVVNFDKAIPSLEIIPKTNELLKFT